MENYYGTSYGITMELGSRQIITKQLKPAIRLGKILVSPGIPGQYFTRMPEAQNFSGGHPRAPLFIKSFKIFSFVLPSSTWEIYSI